MGTFPAPDTPRSTVNFYVTGGTLRRDAVSYVRRGADEEIYEGLRCGDFCYVLTARQMGKSSLMVRTAARLREEGIGVAVLDLTAIGQNLNAEHWYYGLLGHIGRQLGIGIELKEFWLSHTLLSPFQRWMTAIREVLLVRDQRQIIVFIDEIDAVRGLPFSTDEFFAGIRGLYNERAEDSEFRRLTFCLLGVASPANLIRDTRTTPFNIGRRIELHDFTRQEAALLEQGLGRGTRTSANLLDRVFYWTGGQPYLTQRLCQAIAEDSSLRDVQGVDQLCARLFLSKQARERDSNLIFVRELMLHGEADTTSLLTLYTQVHRRKPVPDDEANPFVSALRLTGITRTEQGRLRVRNRIYERNFDIRWVRDNLPNAELQRQRAAYRKGLLRAGTAAAIVIAIISALALTAWKQRRRAEQQESNSRHFAYAAQMNLAAQDWQTANLARMNEMLERHRPLPGQEDLRGFEWYYLWNLGHRDSLTLPHTSIVFSAAFSPDGTKLATGTSDSTVKIWNVATGRELMTLRGQDGAISAIEFSPDGSRLATASHDASVKLWEVATGQEIITFRGHSQRVSSVAFRPDGKTLATASWDGLVKLWDAVTGKELKTLKGNQSWVWLVAFSPDGSRLASAGEDHTVRIWTVARGEEVATLKGHGSSVYTVAFSPDGSLLASGGNDHSAKIWDVKSGGELATIHGHQLDVNDVKFSRDGRWLVTASDDHVAKLWEIRTWRELATFKGHTDKLHAVAFSPDCKTLVTASEDHTAKIWEIVTNENRHTLRTGKAEVHTVAISPDHKTLATGSGKAVQLWDAATGQPLSRLDALEIRAIAFSPNSQYLAIGSRDNQSLILWEPATGRKSDLTRHEKGIVSVAFSPDGQKLVSGGRDHIAKLWDVTRGRELGTLAGHTSGVKGVAFSSDGLLLATCSDDFIVRLWNTATAQQIVELKGHTGRVNAVAFSSDGKYLATGSADRMIKLWDGHSGKELGTLRGHAAEVRTVAFSPGGKRLASGGEDHVVKIWDLFTAQELATLNGHTDRINSLIFSQNGNWLLSGSRDGTARVWRADPSERRQQ